jgi:glucosamine--fructose-6-phosphate aminotransferase (isomerizing)
MCGIFGYVAENEAQDIVVEGLKKLEYRGYDSAGVAALNKGNISVTKSVGKIRELEFHLKRRPLKGYCMVGHTRWATHGAPNEINAHPHLGWLSRVVIVHNGIIENYDEIRARLKAQGVPFVSDTDTEVIANLFEELYEGDMREAFERVIAQLRGAYALAVMHVDHPGKIFAYAKASPLILGWSESNSKKHLPGCVVASDLHACAGLCEQVMFLKEEELATLASTGISVEDLKGHPVLLRPEPVGINIEASSKGGFEHYMLKEIYEQPDVLRACMSGRYDEETFTGIFHEIKLESRVLHRIRRIQILACGSSWHAGLAGANMIEQWARIPCDVEISSEFRYQNPILVDDTLVIAISQSGETADTLAAVRELRPKGVYVIGLCNVPGSTLERETDACIQLKCGPEVSVASTKAFTAQVTVLALLALMLARIRDMDKDSARLILQSLKKLPHQVESILNHYEDLLAIARKYTSYESFFFVGRRYMVPIAYEGALKLKEVSYVNANGYPAGELKHGAIALIHPECPTIALCACEQVQEKIFSNMAEIKARNGKIFAISQEGSRRLEEVADDVFYHPANLDPLNPILSTVVCQIFAYAMACSRGVDVDQPRNLAKSVTVE